MQFFLFYMIIGSLFSNFYLHGASIKDSITKPATYKYRVTIPANPAEPNDTIISIETSHVVVDLEGGCLGQEIGNTVTGLNGIVIQPNLTDVEIKNGNITGISGNGIVVSDGCSNVRIKDVHITDCDKGGILVDGNAITGTGIAGVVIDRTAILSCTGFDGLPAVGLKVVNTKELLVNDCFMLYNDAGLTSTGYGIEVIGSTLLKFINCNVGSNGGFNLGAGVSITLSTTCLFEGCIFVNNTARSSAPSSLGVGFSASYCNKLTCKKCRCDGNTNLQGKAAGFLSEYGTRNVFQNCEAEGNTGATRACGFEINNGKNGSIIYSESILNEATASGPAYGILLSGTNKNFDIIGNHITHNKGISASYGIADELTESTNLFIRNQAFNNDTNYSINYPSGITLPVLAGSLSNTSSALPSGVGGLLDNIDINP